MSLNKSLKVDHYSFSSGGGAGLAAYNIFLQQSSMGIDARFLCFQNSIDYQKIIKLDLRNKLFYRIRFKLRGQITKLLYKQNPAFDPIDVNFLTAKISPDKSLEKGAIITLHWTSFLLEYRSFFSKIPKNYPIVLTLHDMNHITGGCHYSWNCDNFTKTCSNCPIVFGKIAQKSIENVFKSKKKILAGRNIHVVADSSWLCQQAKKSNLFDEKASFRTIHYGIDSEIFFPKNKKKSRISLGIPVDDYVLIFVANNLEEERKGLKTLLDSLQLLEKKITCLAMGNISGELVAEIKKLHNFINFGYVRDVGKKVEIYSAADVFVIPSLQEAFGQTCQEAMACGAVPIGSNVGGIVDMIDDNVNGALFSAGDKKKLAECINYLGENLQVREKFMHKAREKIVSSFAIEDQVAKYTDLFAEINEHSKSHN